MEFNMIEFVKREFERGQKIELVKSKVGRNNFKVNGEITKITVAADVYEMANEVLNQLEKAKKEENEQKKYDEDINKVLDIVEERRKKFLSSIANTTNNTANNKIQDVKINQNNKQKRTKER